MASYYSRTSEKVCAYTQSRDSSICKFFHLGFLHLQMKERHFKIGEGKKNTKPQESSCRVGAGVGPGGDQGLELCLLSLFSLCAFLFIPGCLSEEPGVMASTGMLGPWRN